MAKGSHRRMAKKYEEFEFVIDRFTPDTLPMLTLAQCLVDLSAVLGEPEHVHFDRMADGSARALHRIDRASEPRVTANIAAAKVVGSASPQRRAFEALDGRLREHGTKGWLRKGGAKKQEDNLLYFPGTERKEEQHDPTFGPFSQQASLQGRIINVGGKSQLANVNIQHGEEVYFCEATRAMALELAPLLYFVDIRVHGTGKYFRTAEGKWEMRSFRIASYEKLNQLSLTDVVERLRGITAKVGIDPEILKKLAELRSDPSEA
jgi:hypothetical protein